MAMAIGTVFLTQQGPEVGGLRAAEALEDLAGGLHRQHQTRDVEERSMGRVVRLRVQRRLAPPAYRADDHRSVRAE
jgi:hypothetical protein